LENVKGFEKTEGGFKIHWIGSRLRGRWIRSRRPLLRCYRHFGPYHHSEK